MQRLARLEYERFHLVLAHADHIADVLVREVAQLRENERRALVVRQPAEVDEQLAQVLAALDLDGQVVGRRHRFVEVVGRLPAPRPQHREAAVAGDGVQPRPQLDRLVGVDEVAVGAEERVLDRVLGLVGRAEHVAAEGQDAAMVALVDLLEGGLRSRAHQGDEPLVRGQPQQPWRAYLQARRRPCNWRHAGSMSKNPVSQSEWVDTQPKRPSPLPGWPEVRRGNRA